MRKTLLSTMVLTVSTFATSASAVDCDGNLYTMNSGRGDVGILVNIDESRARNVSNYFFEANEIATIHSRALFSASAMAYDASSDRIYYASTPTPADFHIAGTDNGDYTAQELEGLNLQASAFKPHRLAYFDIATQTHHFVGNTRFQITRMTFDPTTGTLYGSDIGRLFTINTSTAEQTLAGTFDINIRLGGYSNWGDFVFYGGELLFVTNTRTFAIDTSDASATVKFFHNVDFVTAATLDQNGEILVASRNVNVAGSPNSTNLWSLNPVTNANNFGSLAYAGLVPMAVDAMTNVTSEQDACYSPRF
ncbi:hypothetical protein A1OQ_22560 [Enterovibrio norvegicus FF-162]|uniref:hypothetical protein n=1 Tax=Enterovibrio norvegicus TaxID=188144 RepID=UPI00030F0CE4|nr:hypothetical protein [Enterovibrio norvegicus]OEE76451.1 hypothetical protein A1OQ_22560 [Enterovibrio norvegicus FF-162]